MTLMDLMQRASTPMDITVLVLISLGTIVTALMKAGSTVMDMAAMYSISMDLTVMVIT